MGQRTCALQLLHDSRMTRRGSLPLLEDVAVGEGNCAAMVKSSWVETGGVLN